MKEGVLYEHELIVAACREITAGREAPGWTPHEPLAFAVMDPQNVRPEWHVVVESTNWRDYASMWIRENMPQRTNYPGGVLVLCPAQ